MKINLTDLLGLSDYEVQRYEEKDNEIIIYLKLSDQTGICPSCGLCIDYVKKYYPRRVKDLPISGRTVYLVIEQCQYHCKDCSKSFTEVLKISPKYGRMTYRYERYIYDQSQESTIRSISMKADIGWSSVLRIYKKYGSIDLSASRYEGVKRIGIDEFSIRKGKGNYVCIIVDLDTGRVLDILENRDKEFIINYFKGLGEDFLAQIELFCSVPIAIGIWRGYRTVAETLFPHAIIVVDRFHVFNLLLKCLDTRRKQLRKLFPIPIVIGIDGFKKCKWLLYKPLEEMDREQRLRLQRAFMRDALLEKLYQLKEHFRAILNKDLSVQQAEIEMRKWVEKAKQINFNPLKRFLTTLDNWWTYILNYFEGKYSNGIVEGINNRIKLIKRMAYGFRNFQNMRNRMMIEINRFA